MIIDISCGECGKEFTVEAPDEDVQRWVEGELIQNALPQLSNEERELLISRTCNDCFTEMFDLPE